MSFVLGGAASGKSAFAEGLVLADGGTRGYLATAQVWDAEMEAKVDRHKTMRGAGWITVEEPLDIAAALTKMTDAETILLDCATLWLTNQLLAEADLEAASDVFVETLVAASQRIVVVSNEVGQGIVPDNAMSRRFREAQGRLNQKIAAQSDLAINVIAGLPMVLKGTLP
ncbi:MAG: bifunctional adenosylcobinamide kinase/adenosylcobinamide-phosphate guanylyltransferase [Pseudomonadota bacterium]